MAVTPSIRLSSVAVDVTPSSMFNSAAVDVTPSRIFISSAVAVNPKLDKAAAAVVAPVPPLVSGTVPPVISWPDMVK